MTARAPAVPPVTARDGVVDRVNSRVLGAMLLVFGSGWLMQQLGVVDLPWAAIVSLALFTLGVGMVITSRRRARTAPLVFAGIALTLGLAVGTSGIDIKGGVGQRTVAPTTLRASNNYRLGVGELNIDLRHTVFADTPLIKANLGVGHLVVRVPKDVRIRAAVDARFGNAVVFGQSMDVHGHGHDEYKDVDFDKAPDKINLDLHVGAGEIEVIRVGG